MIRENSGFINITSVCSAVIFCGVVGLSAVAHAKPDAPPPSQDLSAEETYEADDDAAPTLVVHTDAPIPYYMFGVAVDIFTMVSDKEFGGEFSFSPKRWYSIGLSPAYIRRSGENGFGMEIDWMIRPMRQGLNGFMIGPGGGASLVRTEPKTRQYQVSAGAGYSYVWNGVLFGLWLGAEHKWLLVGSEREKDWDYRLRTMIGFAWY